MKRKIIVACGGAVATSTMAAEEIKELCQSHNIPVELIPIQNLRYLPLFHKIDHLTLSE